MGTFGDVLLFVENLHGKSDPRTVDGNDLDLGSHDEADWSGLVVLEIDMCGQRDFSSGKGRGNAMHCSLFDELKQHGGGKNVNALVSGLLGRHPFFDPRLAAVGTPYVELQTHALENTTLGRTLPPVSRVQNDNGAVE